MNIAFVTHVYRDHRLARRLVKQIETFYPAAPILVIGDGVPPIGGTGEQVTGLSLERLKAVGNGAWTARYLQLALDLTKADVIIKLDPDTCLWRTFTLPDADWFGTPSQDGTFLRGGAMGISRSATRRLLNSKLLLSQSSHTYGRYSDFRLPHEAVDPTPITCQDKIMGDAMRTLGIQGVAWPDVHILGNPREEADPGDFALTHPHPFGRTPA